MIRAAVMYPNEEGNRFDFKYYKEKHMQLVKEKLKPIKIEIDMGVPDKDNNPPPFIAIGYLVFEKFEHLVKGYNAFGKELVSDVPNYTNIEPAFQISEISEV